MASFKVPKHAFDSDELAVLDQAFESAWAAIETHYSLTPGSEEELRTHLSRLIFRLAARGVSDVQMLRDFALIARSPCLLQHQASGYSVTLDRYAGRH